MKNPFKFIEEQKIRNREKTDKVIKTYLTVLVVSAVMMTLVLVASSQIESENKINEV